MTLFKGEKYQKNRINKFEYQKIQINSKDNLQYIVMMLL